MSQTSSVTQVYGSLESMEASLGGGGGFEGFYGSVTAGGVSKVYAAMQQHCGFSPSSFLVDIGGGLGRPLMHALIDPGVTRAIGIEVDEIKCLKSESVICEACNKLLSLGHSVPVTPLVLHRNIEQVNRHGTLDPATHAYTFWEGMPVKARAAFGALFARSSTLQCVAIVQRAVRKVTPEMLMDTYGFGTLKLMATVKGVHMSGAYIPNKRRSTACTSGSAAGSQRSFTGYVFKREDPLARPFDGDSSLLLSALLAAPRLRQTTLPRMLRSGTRRAAAAQAATPTTSSSSAPLPEPSEKSSSAHSLSGSAADRTSPETCASASAATTTATPKDRSEVAEGKSPRVLNLQQLASATLRSNRTGHKERKGSKSLVRRGLGTSSACAVELQLPATQRDSETASPSKRSGFSRPQTSSPEKKTRSRAATRAL